MHWQKGCFPEKKAKKAMKILACHKLRRCFVGLLTIILVLSAVPLSASAAVDHQQYWALQSAYNAALESGDNNRIAAACEGILALYGQFEDETSCYRSITPIMKAAKIYEEQGRFDDALRLYKAYQRCYKALDRLTDDDVSEALMYADAMLDAYAYIEPEVYVHANEPADVPYYGAKNEPRAGTYVGLSGYYDEALSSAYLLYVRFEKEYAKSFSYLLPKTDDYYQLEVAWNIDDGYTENGAIEYLGAIADGSHDAYIIENLQYLATLENCGVILRFGAEVNVWGINTQYAKNGRLEEFKAVYRSAFRHIHDLAEQYAPNTAMVYSPTDISNMYVSHTDFYPGDAYVDWVGFSTYESQSSAALGTFGSLNDAFYKRGMYTNQMASIRNIVETYGDRKPIMISECGFLYRSSSSAQTEAYAADRLRYFYSYVNMLFPQVKAVFYFNTNQDGNDYCLFGDKSHSDSVAAVYRQTVGDNLVMSSMLNGVQTGYTRLSTLNEKRSDLTLSLYAAYPGNPPIRVTYTLDGKTVVTANTVPYTAHIDKERLSEGRHTLSVKMTAGNTVVTKDYMIYVSSDGVIRTEKSDMTDIKSNHWAYPYVSYCLQENFFDGITGAAFQPEKQVSRAVFVTLLGRAAGIDPEAYGAPEFTDVRADVYYAPYVTWAKAAGVTSGTGDGTTFSPNMVITREQICTMLVRFCDNTGIALPDPDGSRFADDAEIDSWYQDGVYTAKTAGIVSGKGGNLFDPNAELTRQEIAVILTNFHKTYIRGQSKTSAVK